MAYVNPACPLPRNSNDAITPAEACRAKRIVTDVENAAASGLATIRQQPPPASFQVFGLPVVKEVRDAQSRINAANQPVLPASSSASTTAAGKSTQKKPAPKIIPLNVSEAEYTGCCVRGTDVTVPQVAPQPHITIPQAPVPIPTPQGPMYVQQSSEPYMPPAAPPVQTFTMGPGTVPKPNLLPVGRYMGYAGYRRGLGAAWGDAGTGPCGQTWPKPSNLTGWAWILLAAGGLGLAMSFKR